MAVLQTLTSGKCNPLALVSPVQMSIYSTYGYAFLKPMEYNPPLIHLSSYFESKKVRLYVGVTALNFWTKILFRITLHFNQEVIVYLYIQFTFATKQF